MPEQYGAQERPLREPLSEIASCGLPVALEVMGERWSLMILRAAFNGIAHFEEFLVELGIARNILAARLAKLTHHGILARNTDPADRRRVAYRLTEKGMDLLPALIALRQWGEKWETRRVSNPMLVDARDSQPIAPITIRSHDDRVLTKEGLRWMRSEHAASAANSNPVEDDKVRRRIGVA